MDNIENPYLVFATAAEAKTALEAIYSNMVKAIDSFDLLDIATGAVVEKDELTPDQAVQVNAGNRHFPVFGVNAATKAKNTESGYTTAWAVAQKTAGGSWVFQKPDDSLMDGVAGYTVEPFDPAWFPDLEVSA